MLEKIKKKKIVTNEVCPQNFTRQHGVVFATVSLFLQSLNTFQYSSTLPRPRGHLSEPAGRANLGLRRATTAGVLFSLSLQHPPTCTESRMLGSYTTFREIDGVVVRLKYREHAGRVNRRRYGEMWRKSAYLGSLCYTGILLLITAADSVDYC